MNSSNPPGSAMAALADALKSSKQPRIIIRNRTRSTELADHAELAYSGPKRSRGLLGRTGLGRGEGLWIVPCEAVHTFFMQFPIDLVYLDRKLRIKKVRNSVRALADFSLPDGSFGNRTSCRDHPQYAKRMRRHYRGYERALNTLVVGAQNVEVVGARPFSFRRIDRAGCSGC